MKKFKKILSLTLATIMCLSLSISSFSFDNKNVEKTMGQIEEDFLDYLNENYPDVIYGTADYIIFLNDLLMFEPDIQLTLRDDYSDILLYANKYLVEFEKSAILNTDEAIYELSDDVRNLTPSEVREIATQEEKEEQLLYLRHTIRNAVTPLSTTASYDATAAANYAKEYAIVANMAEYNVYHADCTNFVSQCLVAGGVPMHIPTSIGSIGYGLYSTTAYWFSVAYYDAYATLFKVSTSFVNVGDLYSYLVNSGSATPKTYSTLSQVQNNAVVGDVVQLNQGAGWYHSIIITGGTKGNLTYCGHTNPALDKSLSTVSGQTSFRVLHPTV